MSALHSAAASTPRRNGRALQHTPKAKVDRRILAAVDGSERSNGVVHYLSKLAKGGGGVEVIVLNVQSLSDSFRLRGYGSFKQNEVRDRLIADLGMPIVRSVGRRLQKAGMSFTPRVEVGDPVETIVRCAAAEHCDLIVVGDPRPGPVRQWIARHSGVSFGSTAGGVAQLANVSVVIAK